MVSKNVKFLDYVCENDMHFPIQEHYFWLVIVLEEQFHKAKSEIKKDRKGGRKKKERKKIRRKVLKGHNFPTGTGKICTKFTNFQMIWLNTTVSYQPKEAKPKY